MSDGQPTFPGDIDLPPEPPQWPKTVGIISIVWGSLGLLCGVCGGVGFVMQSSFTAQMEQQMGGPMPDVMKATAAQMGLMGLGTLLSLMLVVAGIVLVGRKRVARPLHLAYAGLSIVVSLAATAVGVMRLLEQAAWAQANQGDKWAQQVNIPVAVAATAFGLVLGVAWPVFCLVWFAVKKKDPAEGMGPATA